MKSYVLGPLCALASLAAFPAVATAGMRCGNLVVSDGETSYEVKSKCGPPLYVDATIETRTQRHFDLRLREYVERRVTVPVERWTYVLSRNELVRTARFENGKLVGVKTEGRPPKGEGSIARCKSSVRSKGDTAGEILLKCGPPIDVHRWQEEVAVGNLAAEHRVLVSYERWIYDFGDNRFLRILTFENGVLAHEQTGDKGFGATATR